MQAQSHVAVPAVIHNSSRLRAGDAALADASACHRRPGKTGLIARATLVLVLFEAQDDHVKSSGNVIVARTRPRIPGPGNTAGAPRAARGPACGGVHRAV
jgi:hypothetical protein